MSQSNLITSINHEINKTQSIISSVVMSNLSDSQKDDRIQQLETIVQTLKEKLRAQVTEFVQKGAPRKETMKVNPAIDA